MMRALDTCGLNGGFIVAVVRRSDLGGEVQREHDCDLRAGSTRERRPG